MRYRPCSVEGCEDKTSSRHNFPKPGVYPEIFKRWVKACGNKELAELSAEEIHKKKKVCHIHFTKNDITSNIYLKKDAYPTVNLPAAQPEGMIIVICILKFNTFATGTIHSCSMCVKLLLNVLFYFIK